MISRITMLLCVMLAATSAAFAQQAKTEKIVTNGELTPGKEFHLLLIHDGDNYASHIASMLRQPRGPMQYWSSSCNVRLMAAGEPQVMEHHADLMQKHNGQLPILALIQQTDDAGRGATWCSAAGNQIPSTEQGLASWLNTYFEATARAAQQANPLAVVAGPRNLAQSPINLQAGKSQGSYFLDRSSGAPPAYQPGGRRPLINPQLDVAMPDTLNTAVGINAETRQVLLIIGGIAIVCCLIVAAAWIFSAVIIGHAMTDDDQPQTE